MINEVTICGYAGNDAEVVSKEGQKKAVKFSVAVTEKGYTTKEGRTIQDKTEWFYVVAFDKMGDIAEKFVTKGSKVLVKGRLQTREWTTQNGERRTTTEVIAEKFELFSRREEQTIQSHELAETQPQRHDQNDLPF